MPGRGGGVIGDLWAGGQSAQPDGQECPGPADAIRPADSPLTHVGVQGRGELSGTPVRQVQPGLAQGVADLARMHPLQADAAGDEPGGQFLDRQRPRRLPPPALGRSSSGLFRALARSG